MVDLAMLQALKIYYNQKIWFLTSAKDSMESHTSPGESTLNLLPDTSIISDSDFLAWVLLPVLTRNKILFFSCSDLVNYPTVGCSGDMYGDAEWGW